MTEGKTEQETLSERAAEFRLKLKHELRMSAEPHSDHMLAEAARLFDEMERESGSVAEMGEALRGMLESYELVMQSSFGVAIKEPIRGFFLGEPERARAALAKAGIR
jgi:hypothetical protein